MKSADGATRLSAIARGAAVLLQQIDDPEVCELGIALTAWVRRAAEGEAGSLESALALRQRGGVSAIREEALAQRDAMLCRLHRTEWPELPPLAAAKMMVQSAKRYRTDRWPREREAIAAPPVEPAATWWRILRAGMVIPKERRMTDILRDGNFGTPFVLHQPLGEPAEPEASRFEPEASSMAIGKLKRRKDVRAGLSAAVDRLIASLAGGGSQAAQTNRRMVSGGLGGAVDRLLERAPGAGRP